ncbi:NAD(P)-dependent oxidoreductase [Thiosulfatimonas sediminis]|uniref:dTDP-4-dehydrorhamnose reductase n=1 Tax=Thiosulfatimonas sediminis TaxID=2675054 RepID=A0A6F8PVK3_9GAMM|nr:dTDP-4-dehydrorhamnose reductase [Thiosulfatimonas sediminis]BBP46161.1 NAD(P)-dependent oxidoreductase [Thiosulfatimonas sediminis]
MNLTSNIKNQKSILVTGKNGQLGQSLYKLVTQHSTSNIQHCFTFVGRDELDLADSSSIEAYFQDKHFDCIINCAAYTAVDKAESEPELADQINHLAVKQLAEIAKKQDSTLIHISTDYVFNGKNHKPYVESDSVDPQCVYGLTKLKGEQAIQAINPKSVIIRTSWVYSELGNNFVKTMLRLGAERDSLNVIFDQVGSPTYAGGLAQAILQVIASEAKQSFKGKSNVTIYHYSNEGVCSWYDFAKAIFALSDIKCQVSPIETKDYPTPATRPHYSLMNKAKMKNDMALEIPYWRDSLIACLNELKKNTMNHV